MIREPCIRDSRCLRPDRLSRVVDALRRGAFGLVGRLVVLVRDQLVAEQARLLARGLGGEAAQQRQQRLDVAGRRRPRSA